MPAVLPADERAAEAEALSADESDDGTLSFMSDGSMPALVPADSRNPNPNLLTLTLAFLP